MSSKNDPLINDEMFDQIDELLFQRIINEDYAEEYGKRILEYIDELPDCEEDKLTPKKLRAFERRLKHVHNRTPMSSYKLRHLRILIPAAILIAAMLFTAGAFRIHIFNLFGVSTSDSTSYTRKDDQRPYEFGYIPDDYIEQKYDVDDGVLHAYLSAKDDIEQYINLYIYFNQKRINEDSEGTGEVPVTINGINGKFSEKMGIRKLTWIADQSGHEVLYHISSTLGKDELIKFAENIFSANATN